MGLMGLSVYAASPGCDAADGGCKKSPYIRANLAQSLVLGITGFVVNSLLSAVLIGCITWPLYLVLLTYYGVKAYHGEKI
jgi:hypothetical protein